MPARKRTAAGTSMSSHSGENDGDDVAYRMKRQRNNDAVKKTREKSRQTADARKQHVEELRRENQQLEIQIKEEKKNVQYLKDLLLPKTKTEDRSDLIKQIVEEDDDDDDTGVV